MIQHKICVVMGMLVLVFPLVGQQIEKGRQVDVVADYQKDIGKMDDNVVEKCLKEAEKYNKNSSEKDYDTQLNLLGNGMMGSIEIPSIDANIPIYHGTTEEVLAKGIGHLCGSSLPVGGPHTHSVLTGHRGLPNAELLTRLDEMKIGDIFSIRVCGVTLTYKVCKIKIIKPCNVEWFAIQRKKDLVSLVTCTPYGINTHRLVVTGERILDEERKE